MGVLSDSVDKALGSNISASLEVKIQPKSGLIIGGSVLGAIILAHFIIQGIYMLAKKKA